MTKSSVKEVLAVTPTNFVKPGAKNAKSGCLWCPLLAWSPDFDSFAGSFCRNAKVIQNREPDGHVLLTRKVEEAWDPVDILFVGETPGKDDDTSGLPLTGRGGGGMLRVAVEELLGPGIDVGYANIIRCRPPRGRKPNKTEVQACSPELVREIQVRQPRVIVAMGNFSLELLTKQTGISSFHGKVLDGVRAEFPDTPIVACLHPSYTLRFDHEIDRFVEAIQTAKAVYDGTYEPMEGVGEYYTLMDVEDVEDLLEAFVEDGEPVAFDTEDGALKWWPTEFPNLLCLSFSNEAGTGFTVPLDHAESPWRVRTEDERAQALQGKEVIGGEKEDERPRVIAALKKFFESKVPMRAQNGKFDVNHLREHIKAIPTRIPDTMATHLTLDETRGSHGLKRLAYQYSGMGGYELPLDKYIKENKAANPELGGSYANIPASLLFTYAAMDADVTKRADIGMREEEEFANNPRFQALSDRFFPPLSDALAEMEWNGAQIDLDVVHALDKKHSAEMDRISKKIQKLGTIRKYRRARVVDGKENYFNPGSWQQLGVVLFDPAYYGARPRTLTKTGFDRLSHRFKIRRQEWLDSKGKKLGNEPHFQAVIQEAMDRREWQHFSTNAEVLQELDDEGVELAKIIVEYRMHSVLHGTFVKPLLDQLDLFGRIHGSFLLWGTVTGRLASREPNLQNIPNKDAASNDSLAVKRAYVSRFGADGLLVQADYSQVELRIAASIFDEDAMLEAYRNGEDVHQQTGVMISNLSESEYEALPSADKKQWRTRAKRINFGILYGGGPAALVKTLKKDGIFITTEEAEGLIELYFIKRPKLKQGIEALEREVCRTGYLESFTGRRRRVPEVKSEDEKLVSRALRQSINFPVQSGASDMTLMALVLIYLELKKRGLRSKLILTVHDSIIVDCHVEEFAEVAQLMKEIMEDIPARSKVLLPDLDWSWLRTPIIADLECGSTWGTLVEFDPHDFDIDELWDKMADKEAA